MKALTIKMILFLGIISTSTTHSEIVLQNTSEHVGQETKISNMTANVNKEFTVVNAAGKQVTLISAIGAPSNGWEKSIIRISDNCNDIYLFGLTWRPDGNIMYDKSQAPIKVIKKDSCK